jgi:hypothetical protein
MKATPAAESADDPIHLFLHFRRISKDSTKSAMERSQARHDAMDCWNLIPWGFAADVLDMEKAQ